MPPVKKKFDVAIIGSGIAGTTLGTILARQGLDVVIFEGKSHPRFAIGESMILETSETMRAMAELYDVPELAYFSSENYFSHIGTSHGVKRHFSFLYHDRSQAEHNQQQTLQAIIPKQPHGHELHLYRQDSDYFLMTTAIAYGATVLQNTMIQDVNFSSGGVEISTSDHRSFEADYIVDAGGARSVLAEKFDLRHRDLQTQSRAIFTHMVNVSCFHDVAASKKSYGLPFAISEGTLHHVFEGGWLWVIPFDNHTRSTNPLCSVGLMLDPRVHPPQEHLNAEEEFFDFIQRFPAIEAQFKTAKAVRDWTRTGRIQYSSKRVVGDRFCLLGHAAGFIDPLFSKGLYSALMGVSTLANLLLDAHQNNDYSTEQFQPLETLTLNFIQANDRLIAGAYKTFGNYKLWNAYTVLWLLGAYTELIKLHCVHMQATDRASYYAESQLLKLVGGGFAEFDQIAKQIDAIVDELDLQNEVAVNQAVSDIEVIFTSVEWLPPPFLAVLAGENHLPANKLKLRLLKPENGFMGRGAYRRHFFGDQSFADLAWTFLQEKMKYSSPALALKRRRYNAAKQKQGGV